MREDADEDAHTGFEAMQVRAGATLHGSFTWAAQLAKNATAALQDEYKFTFDDHCTRLFDIRPNLVAVEFPTRDRRRYLASLMNGIYGSDYLVVNLSGETYDTSAFEGRVMDVVLSGCVPPLEILLRLCVSVHSWLVESSSRRLIAHGSEAGWLDTSLSARSFGPAVVLFACYLSWLGSAVHPLEAMLDVCELVGISEASVQPSQRRYLTYFELLQRGVVEPSKRAPSQLKRIILVGIGGDELCRTLEVWQRDQLLFSTDLGSTDVDGAFVHVSGYCSGDLCVRILRSGIAGQGAIAQVLEMQVCFHTTFVVDGFVRFTERDIDACNPTDLSGCSIDVLVIPDDVLPSPAANLNCPLLPDAEAEATIRAGPGPVEANSPTSHRPVFCGADGQSSDAGPQFFDMSAEPQFFDLSAADAEKRTVFAPDDIDAFFDDLL
mmetsp:Transcript_32657/g.63079  ORF Transcript_32657/g.63079 Transcript_32657/m.63079 type:complete len:436 (-) Transcript_32657:94-1401(-)